MKALVRTPATPIESRHNATFRQLLALHTAKGILKHRLFLVGGAKLVHDLQAAHPDAIVAWIGAPTQPPPSRTPHHPAIILAPALFDAVNVMGTPGPLLLARLLALPTFETGAAWPDGCTLFVPFGDPDNVGAALRSAAGLGAARAVLTREAALPFLPKAVRASAGAVFRLRLECGPGLADLAAITAPPLFALDMDGTPLDRIAWPARFGLIAGREGLGLPDTLRRRVTRVGIPLHAGVESLNAAAAVAVALWTACRKRAAPGNRDP